MDAYRKESAVQFGSWLRQKLIQKYPNTKITANFLASNFNLRSTTSNTISNETARKWLNGIALPSIHRFETIKNWLGSDVDFLITYSELETIRSGANTLKKSQDSDVFTKIKDSNMFSYRQIEFLKNLNLN
jgi:transcriptional regulator with XRE-family HTH domain